jgi:hypothetical protein
MREFDNRTAFPVARARRCFLWLELLGAAIRNDQDDSHAGPPRFQKGCDISNEEFDAWWCFVRNTEYTPVVPILFFGGRSHLPRHDMLGEDIALIGH